MTLQASLPSAPHSQRAAWMRVLALANPDELRLAFEAVCGNEPPAHEWLRKPQTGMAMVRARAGGTGDQFNFGEMTITRCAVTLADGVVGIAYVQGRSAEHAKHAALADALLQMPQWHTRVQEQVIVPLEQTRRQAASAASRKAAQTKVEFFTLARGENQ